jgi:hypothetical protein
VFLRSVTGDILQQIRSARRGSSILEHDLSESRFPLFRVML